MALRILAAIAVILGLTACSGGGGSGVGTVTIDTAEEQRTAISSAIQTAGMRLAPWGTMPRTRTSRPLPT